MMDVMDAADAVKSRCSTATPARRSAVRQGFALLAPLALALLLAPPLAGGEVRDVLGSAHAGGLYNFTAEDYLDEGADQLLLFGTRVIKVWLTPDTVADLYPFNSNWAPQATSILELAQKPYFQSLFAKPFTTYLLVVEPVTYASRFLNGMTAQDIAAESAQMHDLARYLLTTYAGSGKTFVLQNWEGDHLLRQGLAANLDPGPVRIQGMIDWLNARQQGVAAARAEVGETGVRVVNAVEVNDLWAALGGKVTVTNNVVPFTRADLYSYSSWDVDFDPVKMTEALDYLATKAPSSTLYGQHDIYVGEFGAASYQVPPGEVRRDLIDELAETALAWGARYVVYWQVYDNVPAPSATPFNPLLERPTAAQLSGYWLILPSGARAVYWPDLQVRLSGAEWHIALHTAAGRYLSAPRATGGSLRVEPEGAGPWEIFGAVDGTDPQSQPLRSGSTVSLQAHGGRYLQIAAGTGELEAGSQTPPLPGHRATTFVLRKVAGSGPLADGDAVIVVESATGQPLVVDAGNGSVALRRASSAGAAAAAVFYIEGHDGPGLPPTGAAAGAAGVAGADATAATAATAQAAADGVAPPF
jgi:hypothetical protein